MSSIIEGFNYDIFVSYRQKDNKGDRWVSEFVTALKDELDATFKENISIYFDENPHDGLLETHDVDASLKEKMKCLVFIPVISRTYCDPKAFAWEHEFLAFVNQASEDKFGLKVTLPNGNVATRVLPVRIHELSVEDTKLVESVLGGIMRGVDFIYKSPGVNRPLRSNEDHPQDNQNKTYYRDQINKVANAISDIIYSLKYGITTPSGKSVKKTEADKKTSGKYQDLFKVPFASWKSKRRAAILFFIFTLSILGYLTYRYLFLNKTEKTFAFVCLQNSNNDSSLNVAADEFISAVYQKLIIIKDLSIKPPFLTDQYDPVGKSPKTIRRDLGANFVLFSKLRKEGQSVKIVVDLSNTKKSELVWNKSLTWSNDLLSKNLEEIVLNIVDKMNLKLSGEEERLVNLLASQNPVVNMGLMTANGRYKNAWDFYNYGPKLLDSVSFKSAVEDYNRVLEKDSTIAEAYAKRAIARSFGIYLYQIDSSHIKLCLEDIKKARSLNNKLSDIDIAQGFYFYYCKGEYDEALESFRKAYIIDPGNYQPLFYMSLVLRRKGEWQECLRLTQKVVRSDPREALFLTNIGMTYLFFHKYDSARIYNQKAIEQIPEWKDSYANKIETLILEKGVSSEAKSLIDETQLRTGDDMIEYRILISMYERKYEEALALTENADLNDFHFNGEKYLYMAKLNMTLNNSRKARQYYEAARIIISESLKKNKNDITLQGALGLSYAGLGNKSKALEELARAIQMASVKNKMNESEMKEYLAQAYTILGDYDKAFAQVLFLLSNPSFISKESLKLDPVWKPLMSNPQFKKRILTAPIKINL